MALYNYVESKIIIPIKVRNNKRRELERLEYIEKKALKDELDQEYEQRKRARKEEEERKTAKKREKRLRQKGRRKRPKTEKVRTNNRK